MSALQGSIFNIGVLLVSVLSFTVKDVEVQVKDMIPLAPDRSTIADFDFSVIDSLSARIS